MKILITALPKSGTTALYHKIKNSLSGNLLCLFEPKECDASLRDSTDIVLAKILLVDDSFCDYESFKSFERKILIVRDPRDSLISLMLYSAFDVGFHNDYTKVNKLLDLLREKEARPGGVSVLEIFQLFMTLDSRDLDYLAIFTQRMEFSMKYHDANKDFFVLRYEQVVRNEVGELERYLGRKLTGSAVVDKRFVRVERSKGYGDWKNWFLLEDIDFFRPLFSKYMKRYGYSDDWQTNKNPKILPQYSSKYVQRLIRERRMLEMDGTERKSFTRRLWRRLVSRKSNA